MAFLAQGMLETVAGHQVEHAQAMTEIQDEEIVLESTLADHLSLDYLLEAKQIHMIKLSSTKRIREKHCLRQFITKYEKPIH